MIYRKVILVFIFAIIIFSNCTRQTETKLDTKTPNILVLIADDAGWQDFGCYGNDVIRTPNIDALAARGFKAENAFLTIPQCSPSRISILTGKYPHQTGAEDLHMPLPADEIILPTYLKQKDYFTGYLQKGHLGPNGEGQFDWHSKDLHKFSTFLDSTRSRPFFMWVGFQDPHRPYKQNSIANPHDPDSVIVPPYLMNDRATRVDLALYYDEIARMDSVIGSYIKLLGNRDLLKNTLIIFFSDNGAPFPRAKGSLYDSGIKTPLIFHWPNLITSPAIYTPLMSVIDLAPTVLHAAGLEVPDHMEGASILPILQDPAQKGREFVFSERNWHNCDEHMRSVRSANYKLITNAYTNLPHGTAADISASPSWQSLKNLLHTGKLSQAQAMLFTVPRPTEELYDLKNDPFETQNLIADPEYREIAQILRHELQQWQTKTNDFPPTQRRRMDNTDRFSGIKFDQTRLPPRLGGSEE